MSSSYVSRELRKLVAHRAGRLCEYCLLHEDDTFFGCEIDHVISEKHGGETQPDNLAYACLPCNRNKGSDIASWIPETGALVRLFNPRRDVWSDHFRLADDGSGTIVPLTEVGEVTARLLAFNVEERKMERLALQAVGCFPSGEALSRMVRRIP